MVSSRDSKTLGQHIAAPLSDFWANGMGPSRYQIASVLETHGLDPNQYKRNKQELVRRSILSAADDVLVGLVTDLVGLLRAAAVFEDEDDLAAERVTRLQSAFDQAGVELSEGGSLSWWPEAEHYNASKAFSVPGSPWGPGSSEPPAQSPRTLTPSTKDPSRPHAIFLVHGRDTALRTAVENQLHRWRIKPHSDIVILDQEASRGRAIIEKFEDHAASAAFAIILASPDDVGRLQDDGATLEPRARQNVIFEMGYFFAKLGRGHVVVLNAGITEPSDISGITYIAMNDDDWAKRLARELMAAGMDGDWLR